MKIKKRLIRISNNSVGVIIDKIVKNSLNLNKGDMVHIDIKKIYKKRT